MTCLSKRVLIGLGVVALVMLAISPRQVGSAAPLLMFAICPLSMMFMMRGMSGRGKRDGNGMDHADASSAAQLPIAINSADATSPEMRELEEEINRLKAELRLRDQAPSN